MLKACHRRSVDRLNSGVFIACICLVLAGCTSGRLTVTASSVPDVGERVRTKNRYRISAVHDEVEEALATPEGRLRHRMIKANWLTTSLAKFQPDVFAAEGIPIVVKGGAEGCAFSEQTSPLGVMVFLCSAGILPAWKSRDLSRSYGIETIDGKRVDQRMVVDLNYLTVNTIFPFFRWIWLATQAADEDVLDGHRAFVTCFQDGDEFVGRLWGYHLRAYVDGYAQRALAYSIAVRLKQMEEGGNIRVNESGGDK